MSNPKLTFVNKEAFDKKRYLTTVQRRAALKLVYNESDWPEKVDRMSNRQVYAIFDNLRRTGQISYDDYGNLIFRTKDEVRKLQEARSGVHQVTLDEYLKELEFKEREQAKTAKDFQKGMVK